MVVSLDVASLCHCMTFVYGCQESFQILHAAQRAPYMYLHTGRTVGMITPERLALLYHNYTQVLATRQEIVAKLQPRSFPEDPPPPSGSSCIVAALQRGNTHTWHQAKSKSKKSLGNPSRSVPDAARRHPSAKSRKVC